MGGSVAVGGGQQVEQMSEEAALDLLIDLAIGPEEHQYPAIRASLRRSPAELRRTIREAKLVAHPDRAGSRLRWNDLERALRVLGAA